jgi:hypothetical protein
MTRGSSGHKLRAALKTKKGERERETYLEEGVGRGNDLSCGFDVIKAGLDAECALLNNWNEYMEIKHI